MAQSLQIQSLTVLARTYWANHEFARIIVVRKRAHDQITLVDENSVHQGIDTLKLPVLFQNELKLAILEFGKRKLVKEQTRLKLGVITERPSSRDKPWRECLPKYYRDDPEAMIPSPALRQLFPDKPQREMVVDFFFALVLPNPRDDASAIKECWTRPEFVPIQSIFLDKFVEFYFAVHDGLAQRFMEGHVWRKDREERDAIMYVMRQFRDGLVWPDQTVSNETIPWFVFEVLDCDQRDKFLALRETTSGPSTHFSPLTTFWAQIFCHWPWQDHAFDLCFAKKKELSWNDVFVLNKVRSIKHTDEMRSLEARTLPMLPRSVSFYVKVNDFLTPKWEKKLKEMLNE